MVNKMTNLCVHTRGDNSFMSAQQILMEKGFMWNDNVYYNDDGLVDREYSTAIYTNGDMIYAWDGESDYLLPNAADIGDYNLVEIDELRSI